MAIDQGSSKTQALIGDECGTIYGSGVAEGACHFLIGMEKAMRAVRSAAEAALRASKLPWESVSLVSAGMSGANWPEEFQTLREALDAIFGRGRSTVYNDCVPALYAGTRRPDAVILCAGTAFNAAVLKDRKLIWIYNNYTEKEDEGGKSVAERALKCVFRSATHMGPPTSLTEKALAFFGYEDVQPMVLDFSRGTMPRPVKDFATIVDDEAVRGDRVALGVQYEFGVSVSRYATAALERFGMLDRPVDIVLSGGIFKAESPVMADAIRTEVHRVAPRARVVESVYEPVVGAYLLALKPECEAEWRPRVEETATGLSLVRFGRERFEHV